MTIYELSALGDTESSGSPALCSLRPGRSAVRRCSPWPQLGRAPQQWVSLPRLPGRPVGRKEQGSDGFAGRRTLRAMKL